MGSAVGLPLHLDPLVDVVAEQVAGRLPKVPYLAYLLDGVVAMESQNQFLTWPEMRDSPKKSLHKPGAVSFSGAKCIRLPRRHMFFTEQHTQQ